MPRQMGLFYEIGLVNKPLYYVNYTLAIIQDNTMFVSPNKNV